MPEHIPEDEEEFIEEEEEIEETENEEEDMEDEQEDEDEFDFDGMDGGVDLSELLGATLATEDGDTVCSALVAIGDQLATQNKILLKILSSLSKKSN
jgi:hypothetical protein